MSDPKRRKKAYYIQSCKAKRSYASYQLDAGMRGFLLTCNNAEKRAVQEAYNLFNEYADKMYGCERAPDEKGDHSGDDFEAAIREEVEAMKKRDAGGARRFQVVDSRTTNCVFIRTSLEHPDELVTKIFAELCESQKAKSRFILKLHPILGTCRAVEGNIEKLAEEVLSPFLTDADGSTYCVMYKVRCNNALDRDTIIQLVASVAARINPSLKVKFDDPDLVISVDILQKVCCIGVLKNYNMFKKYNMQEVVGLGQAPKASAGTADSAEDPDAEPSEKNDSESVDVAKSKDSEEVQDLPDAETSESKLELPSESLTVKADASCSDTDIGCPSTEKNSAEPQENSNEAEQNSTEAKPDLVEAKPKSIEAKPNSTEAKPDLVE